MFHNFFQRSAQTAMELAVFGAILVFMIGAIVRQGMGVSYQQNQRFKTMRWAMSLSFRSSEGLFPDSVAPIGGREGNASRNVASILLIEDRLTVDPNKYGAIDRNPYIIAGSGTHSRNLLLPVDADMDLPVFDLIVNNKQFPLTTAGFKTINLTQGAVNDGVPVDWEPNCATACSPTTSFRPEGCPACPAASLAGCPTCPQCPAGNPGPPCPAYCPDVSCSATCNDSSLCPACPAPTPVGCARLYAIVYNYPQEKEWCDHDGPPVQRQCPANCLAGASPSTFEPGCNLNADGRFDLDRNSSTDVPPADRENFSWQWKIVMAFNEAKEDTDPPVFLNLAEGINYDEGKNVISLDVDSDLKSESIVEDTIDDDAQGIITQIQVMDLQEGDVDFSVGTNESKPQFELSKETQLYTFVRDGTYLQIDEGKIYSGIGDARQYIRTARKKDQIDIIQREFQITKDTDRFCDAGGNPVATVGGLPNPVEICCGPGGCSNGGASCFEGRAMDKTCMYEGDPAAANPEDIYPKIFVRSRIQDLRGRKWVTDTSFDDYVNFTIPK